MDRKAAARKAKIFARLARQVVDFGRVYLFGSHATGTPRVESDLDVGSVVRHLGADYLHSLTRICRLRGQVDVRIEPHLVAEDADPQGFLREIERAGIRL